MSFLKKLQDYLLCLPPDIKSHVPVSSRVLNPTNPKGNRKTRRKNAKLDNKYNNNKRKSSR